VHLVMFLGKWPTWCTILFYVFIPIPCMFRATSCSSSGESIVSMQHVVYVTVCRWPFRVQVSDLHTELIFNFLIYSLLVRFISRNFLTYSLLVHFFIPLFLILLFSYVSYLVIPLSILFSYDSISLYLYTTCCIDTIDSPDDEHEVARNM
jgi:hypothetical protein